MCVGRKHNTPIQPWHCDFLALAVHFDLCLHLAFHHATHTHTRLSCLSPAHLCLYHTLRRLRCVAPIPIDRSHVTALTLLPPLRPHTALRLPPLPPRLRS